MATVTYSGQSFQLDARRVWITAASLQYARIDPSQWVSRLADVRQAGFNTVETAVPWLLHEPRPDRFTFEGASDIEQFVRDAAGQGLNVILRVGPYVGEGFDGGGLPGWLGELDGMEVRAPNPAFLDRIARWFPLLLQRLAPLQVTTDGPIMLVQVEHRWHCGNDEAAVKYLGELVRMIRESGIDVPLTNSNGLWPEPLGTIDTWQGDRDLLANLRQLRVLRPDTPRIVSAYPVAPPGLAEPPRPPAPDPDVALHGFASILAAGAQAVVSPFHGGTHFGHLGGRVPGPGGGTPTPAVALGAPVGESGERGPLYHRLRRLAWFSSTFPHLFADLQPELQATVQEPPVPVGGRGPAHITAVPMRGPGGRVIFVFADRPGATTTLLLDDGKRLPVDLGDQCVAWFALDVDLGGRARLDYSSCCPVMLVNRSILVLAGTAGREVALSISDTPMTVTVPAGRGPEVAELNGITVVVVNQDALDETYPGEDAVYVGVSGLDAEDRPCRSAMNSGGAWIVRQGASVETVTGGKMLPALPTHGAGKAGRKARTSKTKKKPAAARGGEPFPSGIAGWEVAPSIPRLSGTSPRFARIKGPATLAACGALSGVGWYRATWRSGAAKKRLVLPLSAGHRVRFWMDARPAAIFGLGEDAVRVPFDLKVERGDQTLTALVRSLGRPDSGNDLNRSTGLAGHLAEVKAIAAKPKYVVSDVVDPFAVRAFIEDAVPDGTEPEQITWSFSHAKRSPVLVHIADADTPGVLLCNDQPVGFHAGASGIGWTTISIDPAEEWFKRGKNTLRFAPLEGAGAGKDVARALQILEVVDELTARADWAFEKWSPPADADHRAVSAAEAKDLTGTPCWWRCRFDAPAEAADGAPVRLELNGLGEGAVFLNDRDLGRYAVSLAGTDGTRQTRLHVPTPWLRDTGNVLKVFDATGSNPARVRLLTGEPSELDA